MPQLQPPELLEMLAPVEPPAPGNGAVTVPLAPASPEGSDEATTAAPPVPTLLTTAASPTPPTPPEPTAGAPPVGETLIAPSVGGVLPPASAVERAPSIPVADGMPHDLMAGQVGAVAIQVRRESIGMPEEDENHELDHEDDSAQSQGHTQDHVQDDEEDEEDEEEDEEPPRQEATQESRGGLLPLLDPKLEPELELNPRPEVHLARKFSQAAWQESPDPLPGPARPVEVSTSTKPVRIALAIPIHILIRFSMNSLQRRKSMYPYFGWSARARRPAVDRDHMAPAGRTAHLTCSSVCHSDHVVACRACLDRHS
jgi:hypothetical protein